MYPGSFTLFQSTDKAVEIEPGPGRKTKRKCDFPRALLESYDFVLQNSKEKIRQRNKGSDHEKVRVWEESPFSSLSLSLGLSIDCICIISILNRACTLSQSTLIFQVSIRFHRHCLITGCSFMFAREYKRENKIIRSEFWTVCVAKVGL